MSDMGDLRFLRSAPAVSRRRDGSAGWRAPGRRIAAVVVAVGATAGLIVGPAGATTTTTRPERPGVFTPSVSPTTIDNRHGCGHSTNATISTGTTGKVDRVTFRVEVGGRTTTVTASGSGSRWSAALDGAAFGPDHGSGSVRATATGPSGSAESGNGTFTIADCPA
jgi:hypothetical protein